MSNYSPRFQEIFSPAAALAYRFPHPNPTFGNPAWSAASARVLIVRLSTFQDVDCSTGHLFLFHQLRRFVPGAFVDFCFFPNSLERRLLNENQLPLLLGMESLCTADEFDLVLISNACTLELINLPYLLIHSAIPLMAAERHAHFPPFLLGGSNALITQALITESGASLVDGIFFGEGEQSVGKLLQQYLAQTGGKSGLMTGQSKLPRQPECLEILTEQVPGLWVAGSREKPVIKHTYRKVEQGELPVHYPLMGSEEAGTARLQISYGCPFQCTFCLDGCQRRPYREVPLPLLLETATELKKATGAKTLELLSFNFNTYTELPALILELNKLYNRVNFMSQRLDILNRSPELLKLELLAGKSSFTLGIEGISERLRLFYNKKITSSDIKALISKLLREKIREIKLFYMLAGRERPSDFNEFKDFVQWLKTEQDNTNPGMRIIFSFHWLVRLPFTPLQYDKLMLDEAQGQALMKQVQSICRTAGMDFRVAGNWADYAVNQVLARGGYWLHEVLIQLAEKGICYDKELPDAAWTELKTWLESKDLLNASLLSERQETDAFPLEFVKVREDEASTHQKLYEQYLQAKEAFKAYLDLQTEEQFYQQFGQQKKAPVLKPTMLSSDKTLVAALKDLPGILACKQQAATIYGRFVLPTNCAGASFEWLNAWLQRELHAAFPETVATLSYAQENLFSVLWEKKNRMYWSGETIFALKIQEHAQLVQKLIPGYSFPGQTQFAGWLPNHTPGLFQSVSLTFRVLAVNMQELTAQLTGFCNQHHVPVTLKRTATGYMFLVSEQALKKKFVLSGEASQQATNNPCAEVSSTDSLTATLQVGPKFDFVKFWSLLYQLNKTRSFPCLVSQLHI